MSLDTTAASAASEVTSALDPRLESSTLLEDRALSLLGSGVQAEYVASALGVSPSRISQLLSNKLFAAKVSELRYASMALHNKRDSAYDSLEDRLLQKLDKSMPLMVRPESILKAIQIVNGAKRRGQQAPTESTTNQNIVNIVMPGKIAQLFTTNIDNQVIKAGEQELMTMPSGNLLKQVEEAQTRMQQARVTDRVGALLDGLREDSNE